MKKTTTACKYFSKSLITIILIVLSSSSYDIPDIDELNYLPGKKIKDKVSLERIMSTDPAFDEFMSN